MQATTVCRPRLAPLAAGGGGSGAAAGAVRCQPRLCAVGRQPAAAAAALGCTAGLRQGSSGSSSSSRLQRRPLRVSAAAAAADAGGPAEQQAAAAPRRKPREMSMQQRWRAAKYGALEFAERLSKAPAVAALLQALAAVNAQLKPVYDAGDRLQAFWQQVLVTYNAFLAEETKHVWRWSNANKREVAWWSAAPQFTIWLAATLVWQVFMPVSALASLAAPLWLAWVLWDRWWLSPVFLGTLLMMPLKWVPWADMCLVWPGLI